MAEFAGVSLLATGCAISCIHNDHPVVLGISNYIDKGLQPYSIEKPEGDGKGTFYAESHLTSAFQWALSIAKVSFPLSSEFGCCITVPSSADLCSRKKIVELAEAAGFSHSCIRHTNVSAALQYFPQIIGNLNARCLAICFDGNEISAVIGEVGDGVVENYATSYYAIRTEQIDEILLGLDQVLKWVQHDSKVDLLKEVDYCLLTGWVNGNCLEAVKTRISERTSLSIDSVLYEPKAISLGNAVTAGVITGAIKDTLFLDTSVHSICTRIRHSGQASVASYEPFVDNEILHIPRNTCLPTKRIETYDLQMSGPGSLLIYIDELIVSRDKYTVLPIRLFKVDYFGGGASSLSLYLDIDIQVDSTLDVEVSPNPESAALLSIADASSLLGTSHHADIDACYVDIQASDFGSDFHIKASEAIEIARNRQSLQSREILERVVACEKERISEDRAMWSLVGSGIALAFGLGDGLGINDLTFAVAGYKGANLMHHKLMSKKQLEFLQRINSLWLVDERSPLDIRRRLGDPLGRFIGVDYYGTIGTFNIHQSSSRGVFLVELSYAYDVAGGFTDPASKEVLNRAFEPEDLIAYADQLFPSTISRLKLFRAIQDQEARDKDPYYQYLRDAGSPTRIIFEDDSEAIVYRMPIPEHSDF